MNKAIRQLSLQDSEKIANQSELTFSFDERSMYKFKSLSKATCECFRILDGIEEGHLVVTSPEGVTRSFGNPYSKPKVHWKIHHDECLNRILNAGLLAAGESYVDGWWDIENNRLCDFFSIILKNHLYQKVKEDISTVSRMFLHRLMHSPRSLDSAKSCVEHHYDLSNDFFKLMLDETMTYSCGYQLSKSDTLEQLQKQKYDLICKKLNLENGGTLLDVGCGWGGMLIHAARHYNNISGTGITLSTAQYEFAKQRIEDYGLSNRIEVKLCDYRELEGSYDFFVSIGMFEHVGKSCYPLFMQRINELLKPGGRGLLHTIGSTEEVSVEIDPWIDKYIFPGTRLPRLEELTGEMHKANLLIGHVENLKPHYAVTLRKWRENVTRNKTAIRNLDKSFDKRFFRMWNYYLQSCEANFRSSTGQLYQLLFSKGDQWCFPMTFGRN